MINSRSLLARLALAHIALAAAAAPALAQQAAFDRTKAPALAPTPPLTVPTATTKRLANGPALHVVEHRELPLVQVTLTLAGGGRLDRDQPGLATFVANLLDEGAGTRDANALQSELAYLGASLFTSASWDFTTISLKVSRRNLEAALDLMADVVLRPTFAAAEVRRQRDLRLASILQQKDQPNALANLAINQAIFPVGHPYRNALGGDSASTAALDSATVRNAYDGSIRPERATFYVVGDLSATDAERLLAARFGKWTARGPERRPAPVLVNAVRAQGNQVILVDKPGAAQSVIVIAAPGVERTSPDYAAISVMNTILGGSFSSRLNTVLRETKGYTYGAGTGFAWRPLPGPFSANSSVRTNVTDSSLVEFFREMKSIRDTPVSAEELARAKAYLTLAIPGDLESVAQIAGQMSALSAWNLKLDELRSFVEKVEAVTVADVQRVAQRYVPAENAFIVVVGDLNQIRAGIEALRLGTITVRDVNALTKE